MTEHTTLPTVEQAQEFLRLVNAGRQAAELEPLDVLNFDGAIPCNPNACLSATNLFIPCGFEGVADEFGIHHREVPTPTHEAVARALGAERYDPRNWRVSAAILAVTDPFEGQTEGLRARLVEAGVVAP